ncbi:hypothetical protein D3C76_723080 [compost metagenome]
MHVKVTSLQFFVGQTGIFTTEYQSDFGALPGFLDYFGAALARIQQWPGNAAVTGAGAKHQIAADQGIFQGGDDLRIFKDVTGTGSTSIGFVVREDPRFDQHQSRQTHVFHGARGPADVAGVAGIDQDDTNVLQQGRRSRTQERGANLTEQPTVKL